MLEIKIDLVPFGVEAGRATIDRLYIANLGVAGFDSEDRKIYSYGVWLTDPRIKRGKKYPAPKIQVEHIRDNGAMYLAYLALAALYRSGPPKRKREVAK